MKRQLSIAIIGLLVGLCMTSCSSDDKNEPQKVDAVSFEKVVPTQFGATYDELKSSNELIKTGVFDEKERTCTFTPSDEVFGKSFVSVALHFDTNNIYRYATIEAKEFAHLASAQFKQMLQDDGWNTYEGVEVKDKELLLKKGDFIMRVFTEAGWAVTKPTILLGPDNQKVESWTRIKDLKNTSIGIWSPLAALGCRKSLFEAYEQLWGHTVNAERTNVKNGFYAYNTGDSKFPLIGYYYDLDTDSWLEECTIHMDYDNPPSAEELEKYVLSLGFFDTGLRDKDGNKFFYNRETKVTCGLFINNPNNLPKGKFSPRMDFMLKADIEDQLPQEKVDIPWPLTRFEKATMEEALKHFEDMGYKPKDMGGYYVIENQNPDFPQISIFSTDDPKIYGCVFMTARDMKVMQSPDIIRQIEAHGYVLKKGPAIPTYVNEAEDAEVQISNVEGTGFMGLGFEKIGS